MAEFAFPGPIQALPEADISFRGIRGWPRRAGWGVVVEGEMVLIPRRGSGETRGDPRPYGRTYDKGDSYFIPAGVVHSALFKSRVLVVDFFADPDRYQPKADAPRAHEPKP